MRNKRHTLKRKKRGGLFNILPGFERIRGQRYDKWLEQRLVLVHNDTEFVNKVRKRFGYDKTNIVGRGQLTKKMVEDELCARSEEERQLIDPSLKCDHRGGKRKTRKRRGGQDPVVCTQARNPDEWCKQKALTGKLEDNENTMCNLETSKCVKPPPDTDTVPRAFRSRQGRRALRRIQARQQRQGGRKKRKTRKRKRKKITKKKRSTRKH